MKSINLGCPCLGKRAYEALNQFNWTKNKLLAYEQGIKRIMNNRAIKDHKIRQIQAKTIALGVAEVRKQ